LAPGILQAGIRASLVLIASERPLYPIVFPHGFCAAGDSTRSEHALALRSVRFSGTSAMLRSSASGEMAGKTL